MMTFNKDFLDGQLDALLCYLQAEGVTAYEYKNHEGWKIRLTKR